MLLPLALTVKSKVIYHDEQDVRLGRQPIHKPKPHSKAHSGEERTA